MESILIISHQFPPEKSGHASRIYDLAHFLTSMNMNVIVIAPHPTFHTGDFRRTWKISNRYNIDGIDLINLWTWQPGSNDPNFVIRMLNYLIFPFHALIWAFFHRASYQVVMTTAPPLFTHIPGLFAKKVLQKKWIMDIRDLWIDASVGLGFIRRGSLFERLSKKFEKICLSSTDLVTGTTQELGRRLSADTEITNKFRLLPNGVDTGLFTPLQCDKKDQIIYSGNVGYAQDLQPVILALRDVRRNYPVVLNIVGDGNTTDDLKRFVQSEGLDECVVFSGVVSRDIIPKMISESLIGIAPLKKLDSLEYAIPTKIYEYMSCGVPFIGCGRGEIEHIAEESRAGIIADNTPESIAEAILSLLDDSLWRESMGRSGRDYVKRMYERKTIAGQLKGYIDNLGTAA